MAYSGMGTAESQTSAVTDLLPASTIGKASLGISVLMFVLGYVIGTGPVAGILGVWGVSLFVATVATMVAFRLWSRNSM